MKVAEEWKIWNKEGKAVKFEKEVKILVSQKFYMQTYIFEKKVSKRMPTKKMQNYVIDVKEELVPRKKKVYPLLKERGDV